MTITSLQRVSSSTKYCLDADVFLAAWHNHYPIDVFPGFWDFLGALRKEGRLFSVDRVQQEIVSPVDLVTWLTQEWSEGFQTTELTDVGHEFSMLQDWVWKSEQYLPAAKDEFADKADGWLVAASKVYEARLVTQERQNEHARKVVPIPNLCTQVAVEYCDIVGMLRELGVEFTWRKLRN